MKVVLLPGLDGAGILFKPLLDALPSKIETLVIAYPTHKKLNYAELVEWAISQLPEENFILIGESFSGYIAYQIALRKPENLKSVIFVATFLENPCPFLLGLSNWLPMKLILSAAIPDYIVKKFLLGSAEKKTLIALFNQSIKQVSPQVLSGRLQEIAELTDSHLPCDIKASYIQATVDRLVPAKCEESFKKVFNNINILQVEGAHFILQANPKTYAEIIVNEATDSNGARGEETLR